MSSSRSVAEKCRIDEICDAFECRWQSGERPVLEAFLDEAPGGSREALFVELVLLDIDYRARHGAPASLEEYTTRFPQFSSVFDNLRQPSERFRGDPILVPDSLGQYDLSEPIGYGGFGTVWKAWDRKLDRWVALKLPRRRLRDVDQTELLLREARTVAGLAHPHIVPVYEAGEVDGIPFIASPLIAGTSLRDYLQGGALAPRVAATLARTIADAVAYAHKNEVVHGDLKPSNILLDADHVPHITDFGLGSRKLQHMTLEPAGDLCGTPAYMSPEQIGGREKADGQSDVYALGVILYQMLAGDVPFQGDRTAVFHQALHAQPQPLRRVPRDLETICLKAMSKDRRQRYRSAGEFSADLNRYLHDLPIQARPAGPLERTRRWMQRNRVVSFLAAVALFSSVAAVVGWRAPRADGSSRLERLITLHTSPPGARVVFWQLDDKTGEPLLTNRFEAPQRSPVRMHLPPGDFLVVAALDDGRFHEVYRRVPAHDEKKAAAARDLYWRPDRDDPEAIRLGHAIQIPEANVADAMVYVAGSRSAAIGRAGSTSEPLHHRPVGDVFLDPTEVTVAAIRPIGLPVSRRTVNQPAASDYAVPVSYDEAVWYAELLGKRLPTEIEYEYAATNQGRTRYSWGDLQPAVEESSSGPIGPVGEPAFDRLLASPALQGLCTNVAEWTSTRASHYPPISHIDAIPPSLAAEQRVVRGRAAVPDSQLQLSAGARDPRLRQFVNRHRSAPDIGFRCVRSARPRLTAADFLPRN